MRRGFTMIESALAAVIVGVMMVAAVQTVAASRVLQFKNAERAQGALLAGELMTEVLGGLYEESSSPVFGPEAGEVTGNRSQFDDADDYHGWQETPPQQRDGTPVAGLDQWQRDVEVTRVLAANLAVPSVVDTGAKRITVTVSHRGVPVVRVYAVRTRGR